MTIAIIGAGLSGAACAQALVSGGHRVQVFEKSRGPGGRMATRRVHDQHWLDHGAQYFTARDPNFQTAVRNWQDKGLILSWDGLIVDIDNGKVTAKSIQPERYVALPTMPSLAKELLKGIEVHTGARVSALLRKRDDWYLNIDQNAHGPFSKVLLALPVEQARALVQDHSMALNHVCTRQSMEPCWAVMAAFKSDFALPFAGAFVQSGPIRWIANNATKPGRPLKDPCWTIHACPQWSQEHLEEDSAAIEKKLLKAFGQALGRSLPETTSITSHRWRYSIAPNPESAGAFMDTKNGLGLCGDWCAGSRVEGAYLSGQRLAAMIS